MSSEYISSEKEFNDGTEYKELPWNNSSLLQLSSVSYNNNILVAAKSKI